MLLAGLAATILSSKTLNREHCHGVHWFSEVKLCS